MGLLFEEGASVEFSVSLKKLEKKLHVGDRCLCFLESSFGVTGRGKLKRMMVRQVIFDGACS